MKKLVLALGLVAMLVSSASAAVYSFDAISLGSFQAYTPPPIVTVSVNHPAVTVNLPFQFSSMMATQTVDFTAIPPAGSAEFTFTAPSGDMLRGEWSAIFLPTPNPLAFSAPGTFTFDGGTGMFSGATGGGTLAALILFSDPTQTSGTSTIVWNGQVALVPEPGVIALGSLGLALLAVRRSRRS